MCATRRRRTHELYSFRDEYTLKSMVFESFQILEPYIMNDIISVRTVRHKITYYDGFNNRRTTV